MKRLFALLLVLLMIFTAVPLVSASSSNSSATATVVGGWLRLRAAPSLEASVLSSYYTGTVVTLLDGPTNRFYHVKTPDNMVGYMSVDYLKLGGTQTTDGWVVNPSGSYVNLRQGPGSSYSVIRAFPVGTPLTILEYGTVWSKITIYGYTGYMMSQFIDTDDPTPTPTPVCYAQIWSSNGYGVNLRSGPSKSYGVIGTYPVGTQVSVLQKGSIWDKISVGSRIGWMMNEFLIYSGTKQVTSVTLNNYSPYVGDKLYALSIKPAKATVNYYWYVDGDLVSTKAKYTVTDADEGKEIYLMVEGTGNYTGYAVSTLTDPVVSEYAITGVELSNNEPCVGDTIYAIISPEGADVDYEWYVGTTLVSTASSYTVQTADIGRRISVVVDGVYPYVGYAKSAKSAIVSAGSVLKYVSVVNLTSSDRGIVSPAVGDILCADYLPETATVSYCWQRDGYAIAGATDQTYLLTSSDVGAKITVTVTGTGAYYGTLSATTGMVTDPSAVPVILTTELPDGTLGIPYYFKLTSNVEYASWTVASGYSLPAGLSLEYLTGEISGTPSAAGSKLVRFNIINDNGSSSKDLVLQINATNVNLLDVDWNSLTDLYLSGTKTTDEILALLPKQIGIETTNGTSTANLIWSVGNANMSNANDYSMVATAALDLPDTIINSENLPTSCSITINIEPSEELLSIDDTDLVNKTYPITVGTDDMLEDLPAALPIKTNLGDAYASLTWDLSGYTPSAAETYGFVAAATITLPENVSNSIQDSLTRYITITLEGSLHPELIDIDWSNVGNTSFDSGYTYSEILQALPAQVTILTTNGEMTADLSWYLSGFDEYSEADYDCIATASVLLPEGIDASGSVSTTKTIVLHIKGLYSSQQLEDTEADTEPYASYESVQPLYVTLTYDGAGAGVEAGSFVSLLPEVYGGNSPYYYDWEWLYDTGEAVMEQPEDYTFFTMPAYDLTILLTVYDSNGQSQTATLLLPVKESTYNSSYEDYDSGYDNYGSSYEDNDSYTIGDEDDESYYVSDGGYDSYDLGDEDDESYHISDGGYDSYGTGDDDYDGD